MLTAMTRTGSKAVVWSVMGLISMTSNGSTAMHRTALECKGGLRNGSRVQSRSAPQGYAVADALSQDHGLEGRGLAVDPRRFGLMAAKPVLLGVILIEGLMAVELVTG